MNGSRTSIAALLDGIVEQAAELRTVDVAVCPPFVYLQDVAQRIGHSGVLLGSQDCSPHEAGAYTGEVAASMLVECGCRLAIIGHSERRQYHGETDELVARKFEKARQHGLMPVLCIGETLAEREGGLTEQVVGRQLDAVLHTSGADALTSAVVAYEPVWAIGTGRNATPEQAQAVHAFIRAQIARHDAAAAAATRIVYGGSVKAANAAALFAEPDIDGGLIGGASLIAEEFLNICRAAAPA